MFKHFFDEDFEIFIIFKQKPTMKPVVVSNQNPMMLSKRWQPTAPQTTTTNRLI